MYSPNRKNNYLFLLILLFFFNYDLIAIKKKNNTKRHLCHILFGTQFNDTITIYFNGKFHFKDYYITNESVGVCLRKKTLNEEIEIAYIDIYLKEGDEIKITSNKVKTILRFKYKYLKERSILTINRDDSLWDYEFHDTRVYW